MSWRFVLNCDLQVRRYKNQLEAAAMALACGYKFIAYNGAVLYVDDAGSPYFTGIKVADLA